MVTTTEQQALVEQRGDAPILEPSAIGRPKREQHKPPVAPSQAAGIANWIEERGGLENLTQDEIEVADTMEAGITTLCPLMANHQA